MKKAKNGATKPMGAGRTEATGGTATLAGGLSTAEKLKKLKDMAAKLVPKAQRRQFIEQGRKAIERQVAEHRIEVKTHALVKELQTVLDAHGVKVAHIIVRLPVDKKDAALGIRGWASTTKLGDNGIELLGVLTNSVVTLSGKTVGRVNF